MYKSIETALGEIGYLEKATEETLDEKTANPGDGNFTKYARDMDALKGFYNGPKQGCPWCDVFVDWCFVRSYGRKLAEKLLCQGKSSKGAGCRYSMGYYRARGRLFQDPKPGDQIFFQVEGRVCHTGLVTAVDGKMVYTVEGNTSSKPGVVANGGCVREKSYYVDSPTIAGFGRPDYSLVGESL